MRLPGSLRFGGPLLCLALLAGSARTAETPAFAEIVHEDPHEPWWAVGLRLRASEPLLADPRWRDAYAQYRSQYEALLGDHRAALHFDDVAMRRTANDSSATLPRGYVARDAAGYLARVADTARVIMINERHHADEDRLLTLQLLPILYAKGFRYFAAEALGRDSALARRGYPVLGLSGSLYLGEPVLAAVVREALRLGYRVVSYECEPGQDAARDSLDARSAQARRDSVQAANLVARIFHDDPEAKVLVHAGYAHVQERETASWHPMACAFRRMTGIDPFTVDQTVLSERGEPRLERPLYRAMQAVAAAKRGQVVFLDRAAHPFPNVGAYPVDLQVVSPRTRYDSGGRPGWMTMNGLRRRTTIRVPEARDRWCMVDARPDAEPDSAIALDRAEADHRDRVTLDLPRRTALRVRVMDETGAVLRTTRLAPLR